MKILKSNLFGHFSIVGAVKSYIVSNTPSEHTLQEQQIRTNLRELQTMR